MDGTITDDGILEPIERGELVAGFVGRGVQLGQLSKMLNEVATDSDNKPGRALLIRGRRRVGKSRLVEEFLTQADVPHVFFTASKHTTEEELKFFSVAVARSNVPGAAIFNDVSITTWESALSLLIGILPAGQPSVIVIDELPYLMDKNGAFEGTLQKVFDRELSKHRVLLIGIGSDLAMMEALNEHGRPFYHRATEMVIPPLNPAEVGQMLNIDAADVFDAYLVTGGLPLICKEWQLAGLTFWDYLEQHISDETSALNVSGNFSLNAEFPSDALAREVLTTIGSGERAYSKIESSAGLTRGSLSRALTILTEKRIVTADLPLSTKPSSVKRYRVSDPYLRFWLNFLEPGSAEIARGRGDAVLARVRESWTSYRGRAIEPIIREALDRLLPRQKSNPKITLGGYWTRSNDPEIDIVVADKSPVADAILGVGSIKWLETAPFDSGDYTKLIKHRSQLPGATPTTPLIIVSRSGCTSTTQEAQVFMPDDLLAAW